MAAALTPRGKTLRHLSKKRGITERPPGSNTDDREWGIRRAQLNCAGGGTWLLRTPWCGEWAFWALQKGGVKNLSYRLASVALIEADARASRGPFLDWRAPGEWRRVMRSDLVVLFGHGVHVETVRSFFTKRGRVFVVCDGGNTSSGTGGSQSDGGGSYRRVRPLDDVHGFARVNFPGGATRARLDRVAMRSLGLTIALSMPRAALPLRTPLEEVGLGSDDILRERIRYLADEHPEAQKLLAEMTSGA